MKLKQPEGSTPESVEQAWRKDGEVGAVKAIICKYAKVLDMTDAGRDIKPLATGMLESIDRLKALEAGGQAKIETPLLKILEKAAND